MTFLEKISELNNDILNNLESDNSMEVYKLKTLINKYFALSTKPTLVPNTHFFLFLTTQKEIINLNLKSWDKTIRSSRYNSHKVAGTTHTLTKM